MLTLYIKPGCPFCAKVLAELARLELEFERKDITSDDTVMAELIEKGGQKQVPYLVDSEQGVSMYESDDIVAHLKKHYDENADTAGGAPTKPRIHISDSACVSCEG